MSQYPTTTQGQGRTWLRASALALPFLILFLFGACSRQLNTPSSRMWQAFLTQYNVLYNAREAYETTYQTAFEAVSEDYALRLPIDPLLPSSSGAPTTSSLRFTRTIEKARKAIEEHSITRKPPRPPHWRSDPKAVHLQEKSEYNPALSEAWLLIARSQLYGGDLTAAHTTLLDLLRRYATEPQVRDVARLYLARLYTLRGQLFEAEEELTHLRRGSSKVLRHEPRLYHTAAAELALARGADSIALQHLDTLVGKEPSALQRARLHFLRGQILEAKGARQEARTAFAKAERVSPLPALELAAQLRTLSLAPQPDKGIRPLRRLSRLHRYAPHRSAIYLALAEAFLGSGQRDEARIALRQCIDSAQRKSTTVAEAYTRLGLLALEDKRYPEAAEAFDKALPLLPPQHPDYPTVERLRPGLLQLSPYARTAHRTDSLLRLASLPTPTLYHYIDSLIVQRAEADKKKERLKTEVILPFGSANSSSANKSAGSYFDSPEQIALGRTAFRQRWGMRPLTDDWNRSQRTGSLVPSPDPQRTEGDSLSLSASSADAPNRAAYLRDLPLTSTARTAMRDTLASALFAMASILDAPLERLDEVAALYARLLREFPHFALREEVAYRQLLLALRTRRDAEAEGLRLSYLRDFPSSPRANLLRSPDVRHTLTALATRSTQLYDTAYEAYRSGDLRQARHTLTQLDSLPYHDDELRPKALLLTALTEVQSGNEAHLRDQLETFTQQYPQAELMPYVTHLLTGLRAGRKLTAPPSPLPSMASEGMDTTATDALTSPFTPLQRGEVPSLVLLYPERSSPRHEVYFALMSFIYSTFTQWTLRVSPLPTESGLAGYFIEGFPTASDLTTFRRKASAPTGLLPTLPTGTLLLPLSAANRPLLTSQTLPAYRTFLSE